jgi:cytochrome P450
MSIAVDPALEDEYQALLDLRPDLVENPFPLLARIREQAPVFRHEPSKQFVVVGYEALAKLLLDERFLVGYVGLKTSKMRVFVESLEDETREKAFVIYAFRDRWLPFANGDEHERLRALAHKAFTPKVIGQMSARIETVANELLDAAVAKGPVDIDLITEFAWQFPLTVIAEMLDVPPEERPALREASHRIVATAGPASPEAIDAAYEGVRTFERYLLAHFARRRGNDKGDLLGALLAAQLEDGDRLNDAELVPFVAQLLHAGHETTTNLIANGLTAMLGTFPDQWAMLREDPGLAAKASEETFRYEGSAQQSGRTASVDCELEGVEIKQWDSVTPMFTAANRDPAVFDDPDRFDLHRTGPKHLALGLGPHYCLGASLARMELTTAYSTLARRFPKLELRPGAVRVRNIHVRGFERLPVRLGPDCG